MQEVTSSLEEWYDIIRSSPMFLSDEQKGRLSQVTEDLDLRVSLQRLRGIAAAQNLDRWQAKPKHIG